VNSWATALTLPLLSKELRERANRPRTYIVRVAAALLFFGLFLWVCGDNLMAAELGGIGGGAKVLTPLLTLQLVGIHIFVPALLCGSIASERERGSLDILRLTRLTPWRIILEKYFSGLLPVITFVLLGGPLYSVAYSLGGVEPETLYGIGAVLLLALLEVSAFSILMSTCCRTPVGAFVATYILGAILCWLTPEVGDALGEFFPLEDVPWLLQHHRLQLFVPAALWIETEGEEPGWIWAVPVVAATGLCLLFARSYVTTSPLGRKGGALYWILGLFTGKTSAARGTIEVSSRAIIWRHCRGTVFASPFKISAFAAGFMLLSIGLWWIFPVTKASTVFGGNLSHFDSVTVICSMLAGLLVLVRATNVVATERATQTLDVLLTTPLSSASIVREKAGVLWRVIALILPALLTLLVLRAINDDLAISMASGVASLSRDAWIHLAAAAGTLAVYPFAVLWFCLWLGLRSRSGRSALLTGITVFAALVFVPELFDAPYEATPADFYSSDLGAWLRVVSPGHFQSSRQNGALGVDMSPWPWSLTTAHFATVFVAGFILRRLCLRNADSYLRRSFT
jgi:ABC-type transport system involved in multi-copper enzyme maturation permease subunit